MVLPLWVRLESQIRSLRRFHSKSCSRIELDCGEFYRYGKRIERIATKFDRWQASAKLLANEIEMNRNGNSRSIESTNRFLKLEIYESNLRNETRSKVRWTLRNRGTIVRCLCWKKTQRGFECCGRHQRITSICEQSFDRTTRLGNDRETQECAFTG